MRYKIFILIGIGLLQWGCVTSNIRSKKSPDFNDKLTKVYVMMRGPDEVQKCYATMQTELAAGLSMRGVESTFKIIEPLSLESDTDILNDVIAYQPHYVIKLDLTERTQYITGSMYNTYYLGPTKGVTFDVQIIGPESDKILWRGSLYGKGLSWKAIALSSAKTLVNDLVKYNLF